MAEAESAGTGAPVEGGDDPPRAETASNRSEERQKTELGITARATLMIEARKKLATPDGTLKEPADDKEKALRLYLQISDMTKGGLDFGTDGNPLTLPEINGSDRDGSDVSFDSGQAAIRQIISVSDDGSLECTFSDPAGIAITKTVTDPESGATRDEAVRVFLPREAVLDAQFLSQRDLYTSSVDGDRGKVLAAHADSLPQSGVDSKPDSDLDQAIEKAGKVSGLPTATKVKESVSFKQLPSEQQARLEEFMNGKVVLTVEDMRTVMSYMGSDRLGLRREVKALIKQIDGLKNRTDTVGQSEREEAQNRLMHLEQLDQEWARAEKNGGTPYDGFLQDIQDGRRTPKEAEAINTAILNGDFGPVLDTLPEFQNMSDEEKKSWMNYAKKAGVGTGWIIAILLALPAAVAVAGTGAMISAAGSGRSR